MRTKRELDVEKARKAEEEKRKEVLFHSFIHSFIHAFI